MNKKIMRACGLGEEVDLVENDICPFCHEKINEEDFIDVLSGKEYCISGLCQKCQNKTFGNNPDKVKKIEIDENDFSINGNKINEMIKKVKSNTKIVLKKVIGKSGRTWIYDNFGDRIHVSANQCELNSSYTGFKGYGGSTLSFELEDGSIEKLKAPWHSSSDGLFQDTGIDLREQCVSFVVISEGRKICNNITVLTNVLYKDDIPLIGNYHRGMKLAMDISEKLNKKITCYSQTLGGSCTGPVYPDQINVHGKRKDNDNV